MTPIAIHLLTLRKTLGYVVVFSIITLLVAYVAYQARFVIAGPTLEIYATETVSAERTVTLEGQAYNIVNIELNGRAIYTNERGYFKETLVLENGYTIATVRAKDRYGRTTTAERSFVYKPIPLEPLETDNS